MSATHGNKTTAAWNGQSLGELASIGDINLSADTVDVSTYNATDEFKTFIRGLIDGGDLQITCHFDASDTGQQNFATDFYAGTSRTLLITFPSATGTTWSIPAIPTGLGTAQPMEDKIAITLTVKITGKPTLATATSTGMSALAISDSAVLTPTFAIGTYDYVATVLTDVSTITVTPTAADHTITVTANGVDQTVTSGVASSAITLGSAGTNTTIAIKVQETGKSAKTYYVRVARAAA